MQPYLEDDDTQEVQLPVRVQAARSCRPAITRILGPRIGETIAIPVEPGSTLVVGRGPAAAVRVEDDAVSRRHCQVQVEGDGSVVLVDLGSRNGTLLNGRRVERVRLAEGDKLQVGTSTVFRFSLNDRLDESYLEHLYELSMRDTLTGLLNRRYLLECLERDLGLARRHGLPIALILIDADRFKNVNDTHGHAAGDEVLRALAELLGAMQRSESILARYGGEEFAVLLRNVDAAGVEVFAERMRRAVEKSSVVVDGNDVRLTVSMGVAVTTADGVDETAALLEKADRYLYLSKTRGRNCVTSARTFLA
jgi:diguanylate cyclase (GGDEF)-like protein